MQLGSRKVCLATGIVVVAAVGAAGGENGRARTVATGTGKLSRSACEQSPPRPGSYPWPVTPFHQQHPVRGNFGDPRTVYASAAPDLTRIPAARSFRFHNGVDIVARDGTAVFPVVSGRVIFADREKVFVRSPRNRTFQYWHIAPTVRRGDDVLTSKTLLGHVLPGLGHVHLAEIDGGRVANPLVPGHLSPYRDHTAPVVTSIVASNVSRPTGGAVVSGRIEIWAETHDEPSLPLPPPWTGATVTPAVLEWSLVGAHGYPLIHALAVDFRTTLPPPRAFWTVYAPGTEQNHPKVLSGSVTLQRGRYRFDLTPGGLDTSAYPDATYTLRVRAEDVCGNVGERSVSIRFANGPPRR